MDIVGTIAGGLLLVLIAASVFLTIRSVVLWYWGVSEVHRLLRDQVEATRELHQAVQATNGILSLVYSQLPPPPPANP
jgi:hypothetical protein